MTARLKIVKAQASSVDAFIVESDAVAKTSCNTTIGAFASSVCDYSGPLGASGLFVVDSSSRPLSVEFYAPEGVRATPPAAGLRCVARFLGERLATSSTVFAAGEDELITAQIDISNGSPILVTVGSPPISIAEPNSELDSIDMSLWTVARGTQEHAVGLLQHGERFDAERLADTVSRLPDYARDGATFALPLDQDGLNWAAATWSLDGSQKVASVEGAECVAAVTAYTRNDSRKVQIRMAGGPITLAVRQDMNGARRVDTTGNATVVFTADIDVDEIVYSPEIAYEIDAHIEEMLAFNETWEFNCLVLEKAGIVATDNGLS